MFLIVLLKILGELFPSLVSVLLDMKRDWKIIKDIFLLFFVESFHVVEEGLLVA
jgi:hypothetical protein